MADAYSDIPELEPQAEAIKRRQAIAQAMLMRGMTPIDPGIEARTRTPVPIAWTQGLAQLANAYFGKQKLKATEKDQQALADKRAAGAAQAVQDYLNRRTGTVADPGMSIPQKTATGAPAPAVGTETIYDQPPDTRGAIIGALINQYSPPGLKQAAALDFQSQQTQDKIAAEQAQALAAAKLAEHARLETQNFQAGQNALSREQQARIADAAQRVQMRGQDLAAATATANREASKKTTTMPGEADKKNAVLYQSMLDAENQIKALKQANPEGADTSSAWNAFLGGVPLIGGATKYFQSGEYRKYEAAGLRWAANNLYLKSGATASPAEVQNTWKEFFPQPGDSAGTIAQKNMARKQEIESVYKNMILKQGVPTAAAASGMGDGTHPDFPGFTIEPAQ